MNRRCMALLICTGITACAASGPESPAPAANSEGAAESTAEAVVQNQAPASPINEVDVVDIPEKSTTAPEPGITDVPARSDIVCRRERTTGSNRARKVCRTRAQMDKEELEGKETFEDLHRSQREYD